MPPWKRQYNAIDCLLKSCLNWQETASITVGSRIRANVDNVSQAASQKITFLQDALIYSLRHHLLDGDGVRETGFNFYKALTDLLRKDRRRSELYFYGLAIAKLFRAQMTTRSGGPHGLAWGGNFRYPRSSQRFRLARARRECFVGPGATSDATELAKQLLNSAKNLVDLCQELTVKELKALRGAVVEDEPDHMALLRVWHKGNLANYGLPMDKLWTRSADCVYTKNCIGYDEFVAKELEPRRDDDCRQIADCKLGILLDVEQGWKGGWENVVQNWWCCGFTSGIYSWRISRDEPVVITSGRRGNLHRDATRLVELVRGEDKRQRAYQRVLENLPGENIADVAKEIVRLACEGKKPDDILRAVGTEPEMMYTILFLVAIAPTAPKLQDCWK